MSGARRLEELLEIIWLIEAMQKQAQLLRIREIELLAEGLRKSPEGVVQ